MSLWTNLAGKRKERGKKLDSRRGEEDERRTQVLLSWSDGCDCSNERSENIRGESGVGSYQRVEDEVLWRLDAVERKQLSTQQRVQRVEAKWTYETKATVNSDSVGDITVSHLTVRHEKVAKKYGRGELGRGDRTEQKGDERRLGRGVVTVNPADLRGSTNPARMSSDDLDSSSTWKSE